MVLKEIEHIITSFLVGERLSRMTNIRNELVLLQKQKKVNTQIASIRDYLRLYWMFRKRAEEFQHDPLVADALKLESKSVWRYLCICKVNGFLRIRSLRNHSY